MDDMEFLEAVAEHFDPSELADLLKIDSIEFVELYADEILKAREDLSDIMNIDNDEASDD